MRFQSPRGTEDVLPGQSHRWLRLEHDFRELTALYGYRELRTPTFEEFDLFVRTSGETSDIVTKEMYDFTDKGGRHVALKPEGTAPAMRAVIEHNLCPVGQIARLSYVTPCFRYGRPQKGRLRELHQFGLELVGSASPLADAEIIEITARFYERVGVEDVSVRLNSIGREACRQAYRDVILAAFASYLKDQDTETQERAVKNPLRLVDSKDPQAAEIVATLPPITNFLEDDGRERFETLQQLLSEAGVRYELAPDIVRGLDYYTDTVFEVQSNRLGAQSSLCGGGRYDDLVKQLGGAPTPSVGVGMGVERLLLVLEELGKAGDPAPLAAYVVAATEDAQPAVRALVRELRESGISATHDYEGRKMAAQLKQADKAGALTAVLLGTDELAKGTAVVRHLASSQQAEVPRAEVVAAVRERL